MAKAANTKLIGLFVLAGIALVVLVVVIFGGARLFQPVQPFTMYFSNSVQGLSAGSPVMFRGVNVGQVTSVELWFNRSKALFLTQVNINIFPRSYHAVGELKGSPEKEIARLVKDGLRAQLIPISLVTGQLGIGLDMAPGTPGFLLTTDAGVPRDDKVPEIPTVPSTIERIETTVQRLLAVVEKANMDQISHDVEATLRQVRELITMPELRDMIVRTDQTVRTAETTMQDVKQLVGRIDKEVGPSLTSLRAAASSADATMADARKLVPVLQQDLAQVGPLLDKLGGALTAAQALLQNANATVEPGSPLQYQIANALRELTLTMRSLRGLTDALEQSPNSILFGKISGASQ
jgi:paraquat-inducible protein B